MNSLYKPTNSNLFNNQKDFPINSKDFPINSKDSISDSKDSNINSKDSISDSKDSISDSKDSNINSKDSIFNSKDFSNEFDNEFYNEFYSKISSDDSDEVKKIKLQIAELHRLTEEGDRLMIEDQELEILIERAFKRGEKEGELFNSETGNDLPINKHYWHKVIQFRIEEFELSIIRSQLRQKWATYITKASIKHFDYSMGDCFEEDILKVKEFLMEKLKEPSFNRFFSLKKAFWQNCSVQNLGLLVFFINGLVYFCIHILPK